jgi:thioredoxin reductase (NADPH)
MELGQLMHQQALKYGVKITTAEVTGLQVEGTDKLVTSTEGTFTSKAVIIASGAQRQKLAVPGEEHFRGKGVSYCATCDAPFFRDLPIAIVGGGNTAITEALHLSKFASKVTVIHRRDQLRASAIVQERAFAEPKIDFAWNSVVEEISGDNFVNQIKLRNLQTGEKSALEASGIFISVGIKPSTEYLKDAVELDDAGYIITNDKMETNIPGIYAVGDTRHNSGKQAITAAGEGATAAIYAEKYLAE